MARHCTERYPATQCTSLHEVCVLLRTVLYVAKLVSRQLSQTHLVLFPVQTGSGSDQQLVSPPKPQGDSSDSHQWQSNGTIPPASESDSSCSVLSVQTPPRSGAEDLPTPVKCVDCETQLSAGEVQHRKEQGEAPLCDVCRSAHLSCVQDGGEGQGLLDQASEDTRPSPDVVPEGLICKLSGCPKQAQVKGKYYEFCCKGHYQMYDMMTPSPVPLKPSTSQRSPTLPTG